MTLCCWENICVGAVEQQTDGGGCLCGCQEERRELIPEVAFSAIRLINCCNKSRGQTVKLQELTR